MRSDQIVPGITVVLHVSHGFLIQFSSLLPILEYSVMVLFGKGKNAISQTEISIGAGMIRDFSYAESVWAHCSYGSNSLRNGSNPRGS